jgi:hypothetical protein
MLEVRCHLGRTHIVADVLKAICTCADLACACYWQGVMVIDCIDVHLRVLAEINLLVAIQEGCSLATKAHSAFFNSFCK